MKGMRREKENKDRKKRERERERRFETVIQKQSHNPKTEIRAVDKKDRIEWGGVKGVAVIAGDANVRGSLHFIEDPTGSTHVKGKITGLKPGLHGFHIHALGDTTNGCISTGPHFNPLKNDHGAPTDKERHVGDLGNIVAGPDGVAEVSIKDRQISLSGRHSIMGRAVVVHADPDDLGRGGHELSKTTGNAGGRVGCGIIGIQSSA